ncbi:hypothetical protein QUC32_26420 [Novosphingobium resinovorum]|uniref:hypothetical protein n=1 Tax=Novosphingobium TaxID=165696 RepID=UPI001B3C6B50|nr:MULTISPECIES: hypothetical protein [Novosphingobium]MBF7013165.1 hypothetical protein [Novosphingobium sp. HR1a]WJM27891.1 hypothetical protein QUC32_26420 [Novosphingobium resinovorum]
MPQVTGKLKDGRILLKVGIRPFQAVGPVSGYDNPATLDYRECTALLDTGARRTCVTVNITQTLGMRRIGQAEVWNVKRPERHFTYLFHVGIWPDVIDDMPSTIFGIGDEIEGIDVGNHPYFDVLLGMDIVSQGRLVIEKSGDFSLSF